MTDPGTVATIWVAVWDVAVNLYPFNVANALFAKLEPLMVRVVVEVFEELTCTDVGLREAIVGGVTMVRVWAPLVPPPGVGLLIVICPVPPLWRSAAVRAIFSDVALT